MVSGGADGDWRSRSLLAAFQTRWRRIKAAVPDFTSRADHLRFVGSLGSRAVARLQRRHLRQSSGICQWTVLRVGHCAEDRDRESSETKLGRFQCLFSKGGGTQCVRIELAGPAVLRSGGNREFGCSIRRTRTSRIMPVGAPSVLCALGCLWQRSNFPAHLVAILLLQRTLRSATASGLRRVCPLGNLLPCANRR